MDFLSQGATGNNEPVHWMACMNAPVSLVGHSQISYFMTCVPLYYLWSCGELNVKRIKVHIVNVSIL